MTNKEPPSVSGNIKSNNTSESVEAKELQPNNPLHGKTLEKIVIELEDCYGWDGLYQRIAVNCFRNEPSLKSSLKFLRRTPWARAKVEELYINMLQSPWKK